MGEGTDSAWAEKGALGVGGAGGARGSRNKMHPAQKNCAGLRPGQCPVCVVRGRGEAENSRTAGGERREEQTEMRLFRESVFYNKFMIKIKSVL